MLTDEYIQGLYKECNGASYLAFARAVIAAYEAKLREQEPVYYEYRSWYGQQSVINGWGEWERVKPRNALCTIEDAVDEIDHYIGAGYKYELRALFEHPAPIPEELEAAYKRGRHDAVVGLIGNEPLIPTPIPEGWISVDVAIPDAEVSVLVARLGRVNAQITCHTGKEWLLESNHFPVTHWRVIPRTPEQQSFLERLHEGCLRSLAAARSEMAKEMK